MDTVDYFRNAIEHAPKVPTNRLAMSLLGWWTPAGHYLCAFCAGRIISRGCNLPRESEPVWTDHPEKVGHCCCAGMGDCEG